MQGFLITAYREPAYLSSLINEITAHGDRVLLHIDRKSAFTGAGLTLDDPGLVEIYQRYTINWGSVGHLNAIVMLMQCALKHPDVSYLHIISGQDAIVRYPDEHEFGNSILMNAMEVTPADRIATRRLEQYNCFPNGDTRDRGIRAVNKAVFVLQRAVHRTRSRIPGLGHAYKGVIWSSMPRDAAQFVIEYDHNHPEYMRFLRHTLIPEEFYLQSVIMNSPLRTLVTGSNSRYTDWTLRNSSLPAYLDSSDFAAIEQSGDLFARKIDPTISRDLLATIRAESAPHQ